MKNLFLIIVVLLTVVSCKENERLIFNGDSKIYFYRSSIQTDTLSFALLAKENGHEFDVPVRVTGNIPTSERKFKVEVVDEGTTAVEGTHYELKNEFTFPSDTIGTSFKIKIFKTDPELAVSPKYIKIRLVSSDLEVAYEDRSTVVILLTTALRKPVGNGYFGDMRAFTNFFGPYSKKKHELIIEMTGHDFWDGKYGAYGGASGLYYEEDYYEPYSRILYSYVINNVVYDENGNQIKPW